MMLGDGDAYTGVMSSFSGVVQGLYDQTLWPVIGEQLRDPEAAASETEAELSEMEEPSEEQAAASDKLEAQLRTVERAVICNENTVAPDTSLILQTLETRFTGGDLMRYNEDNIASGGVLRRLGCHDHADRYLGSGSGPRSVEHRLHEGHRRDR